MSESGNSVVKRNMIEESSKAQPVEEKPSDKMSDVCKNEVQVKMEVEDDEVMKAAHRENRLISIIDQLRCQSKLKENGAASTVTGTKSQPLRGRCYRRLVM
ncbi:unnamed protein product [Parnassius apollo]|uniref:(apollo) hypothetical protein n=1 Tax=Parnassius apollo TaxID=110799 RepID=A0A8S3Y3M6_PARAO|nr:unnamed protein product [Parnassius apollo]